MAEKMSEAEEKSEVEEMPEWFTAVDVIRAEVKLTEKDSATLLALPQSDLLKHFAQFRKLAEKLEGDDALEDAELVKLIASEDALLTPTLEAWSMAEIEKAYGRDFPLPSTLKPEERADLYNALPFSVVRRLMQAVALHLGNE